MADYIHRCGRTGRVGSVAPGRITNLICGPIEARLVQDIEVRLYFIFYSLVIKIMFSIHRLQLETELL